ncbi:PTS lactose/cellobiose transporter subunit IIA [Clostridioides difficile]|nr:PTS lactose/cellobiose transporter subunit IIA [Clostridioides difficile]MCL6899424.1 PTS lactose/cellobiose transporter subunit IIA [Clostridioides difficile]MDE3490538.1 PTS lactose/cellobiose transporter subunit IIA [Clostridioides difficile]MDE3705473.1 PTS lactose/cellobiose transporter subunit IIA [Clostridioides difficile]HBG0717666.1 PTS lactose/cellobiose transporter subunit IIA [Clostridioides difficile]
MTTEEHVIDEELVEVAMQIILRAGEARAEIKHALNDLERFDYKNADLKLAKAKGFMTEAHRAQTNIIQGEASGEKRAHSLLFAHAQDTLMTIFSELNITMSLVGIVKSIEYKVNNSK